ncbi:MAG: hypothetical protein CVU42_09680 [Chloroflexi bacterium HGW-Chloroflexi-4]|nr:MAG: hypothetical protein CVU42_09680 [Chloroflexi bacterium HGW-Chloroflexi-4]
MKISIRSLSEADDKQANDLLNLALILQPTFSMICGSTGAWGMTICLSLPTAKATSRWKTPVWP